MQQQKPISIDISNKEDHKKLVPRRQLLTSHDAGWQNMVFEHHHQPAHEMPITNFQQHILVVNLKKTLGEIKMDDRFEAIETKPGSLTLIPANVDYWNADRTDNEFIVLAIEPQQLLHTSQELIKGDRIELIPTFTQPDPFVYGTALALKQELETDYQGCRLYAESLLNSLSVHLLRKYATAPLAIEEYKDGLAPYKLRQVLDLIGDRLGEEVSVTNMANCLNLSPFHFVRQFKKSVGITPYQYVMQQRVEMAKGLLKRRDLSIADVAFDCGFSNQSHLGRVFKKYTGVTPKSYRQQVKS